MRVVVVGPGDVGSACNASLGSRRHSVADVEVSESGVASIGGGRSSIVAGDLDARIVESPGLCGPNRSR